MPQGSHRQDVDTCLLPNRSDSSEDEKGRGVNTFIVRNICLIMLLPSVNFEVQFWMNLRFFSSVNSSAVIPKSSS